MGRAECSLCSGGLRVGNVPYVCGMRPEGVECAGSVGLKIEGDGAGGCKFSFTSLEMSPAPLPPLEYLLPKEIPPAPSGTICQRPVVWTSTAS